MKNKPLNILRTIGRKLARFIGLDVESDRCGDPDVLVADERDNLRGQIEKYNAAVAASAQLRAVLQEQWQKLKAEEAAAQAGNQGNVAEPNDPLATRLRSISLDLADTERQLEEVEQQFRELNAARDAAIAKARRILGEMNDLANTAKARQRAKQYGENSVQLASDSAAAELHL